MFPPINVAYYRCTEAVSVWWGCIAPYSHSVSSGRGVGREREEWEKLQTYYTLGLDSYFGKGMVGNSGQTLTLPCNSRIWMHYSPSTYRWNRRYSQIQLRIRNLCSPCGLSVVLVPLLDAGICVLVEHQGTTVPALWTQMQEDGWIWFTSKGRKSHRGFLFSSHWAHLWWLRIRGPFNSKAQRTLKLCLNCRVHRVPALWSSFSTGTRQR